MTPIVNQNDIDEIFTNVLTDLACNSSILRIYPDSSSTEITIESSTFGQLYILNRGIWSKLEEQIRQWAVDDGAVFVVTGTFLSQGLPTIGRNRIAIPKIFYKVIPDYSEPEIKAIAFLMPNEGSREPSQHYAVTIDSVEKVTGKDFFFKLPDEQEMIIESCIDLGKWGWPKKN